MEHLIQLTPLHDGENEGLILHDGEKVKPDRTVDGEKGRTDLARWRKGKNLIEPWTDGSEARVTKVDGRGLY